MGAETAASSSSRPAPTPRKLRKACSLPTCARLPGQCMHCACDGRCGVHAAGLCGARREGNGRSCKRAGCSRDERCVHSNRATCCHCRNLVSTNGRAARTGVPESIPAPSAAPSASPSAGTVRKRTRSGSPVRGPAPSASLKKPRADLQASAAAAAAAAADAELRAFLRSASLDEEGDDRSLSECGPWRARRSSCNLVVLTGGVQFNLHKHPVLLESALLHRLSRPQTSAGRPAPVLALAAVPGGARALERLCVFIYTGELPVPASATLTDLCDLSRAAQLLELRSSAEIQSRLLALAAGRRFGSDASLDAVVDAVTALDAAGPACQPLAAVLVDVAASRAAERLAVPSMEQLLRLPAARFVAATQRLVRSATEPRAGAQDDGVLAGLVLQAQLAQLQREGGARLRADVAAECLALLQVPPPPPPAAAVDELGAAPADRLLWQMMLEEDEEAGGPHGSGTDAQGSLADVLCLPGMAEGFVV